ncbi:hypothetical protein M426DRAFT_316277 [Hypoxylon sp. CI-4A]|nr:hypothetical protein M426DRAFT_316277 [Hypoxylon sp. CI-4A]
MATDFDISPEKEGSFLQFLYRQFFYTPSGIVAGDVDLQGKTAIVTGSNGGVGLECCRQLRELGLSKLILAVRDEAKGHHAMKTLFRRKEGNAIEVWELELSSYASIRSFVEKTKSLERIDYIIMNAGITKQNFQINPSTGHEENIQVNYLSAALLTILLLPILKSKRLPRQHPSRIVLVNSDAASWAKFPEQDSDPLLPAFDKEGKLDMISRYYTSKLLVQFFLGELAKRVLSSVAVITATTPGLVYGTESLRDSRGTLKGYVNDISKRIIGYSPEIGARQLLDATVNHGDEIHGLYLCSQKLKPMSPIIYTEKGKRIAMKLWQETMNEFAFAGVEQIITEINH